MEFLKTRMNMLIDILEHLLRRQRISSFLALIAAEMAEGTVLLANVGEIKTHVVDEINLFAVLSQVHLVSQLADRQEILRFVQEYAVLQAEALSMPYLLGDFGH